MSSLQSSLFCTAYKNDRTVLHLLCLLIIELVIKCFITNKPLWFNMQSILLNPFFHYEFLLMISNESYF